MAGAASPYGRGLVGLLKQGWNEIPEVVATSVFAVGGVFLGLYGAYRKEYIEDWGNKRFKLKYTVYRDDDPRVKHIKK